MIAVKSPAELQRTGPFLIIEGKKAGAIKNIGNSGAAGELDIMLDGQGCDLPPLGRELAIKLDESAYSDETRSFTADIIGLEASEWTSDVWVKMLLRSDVTVTITPDGG